MRGALACLCLFGLWPTLAEAHVPLWERARRPQSLRDQTFLRTFGRWLDAVSEAEGDPETMQDFRLAAVATAELAGAHASTDPRVLLVLGHALLDADIAREEQVRGIAERLLNALESDQAWLEAEARTLDALASRDRPERAITKVTRALPMVWAPAIRSTLFRERAEAQMAIGRLQRSIRDYRLAQAVADRAILKALARFGLGLALERSGDLPAALVELRIAHRTAPGSAQNPLEVLGPPGSRFFRKFDLHYVSALTAMALASEEGAPPESRRLFYEQSQKEWNHFERAAPPSDPWLPNARLHREACLRALERISSDPD